MKYTYEEMSKMIKNYGYTLKEYISVKELIAEDDEGYKYKLVLSNLQLGKTPSRWMKNPYATENIQRYMNTYYPKYEWLGSEYRGCKTKEMFICHLHKDKGVQTNTFDNIINSHHACKYCGYNVLSNKKRVSKNRLIDMCEKRFVNYEGQTIKNHETIVFYSCSQHKGKEIQQMKMDHFRQSKFPCRICNMSAGERKIKAVLDKMNIQYEVEKQFDGCMNKRHLEFDFYIPQKNAIVEFDGKQHYEPLHYEKTNQENLIKFNQAVRRDCIKLLYCINNGIKMIRIPYWDYENIETILQNELT